MLRYLFSPGILRIIALSVLLLSSALTMATTWTVPGDAASIQGGIDLAATADTVLVGPGTWAGAGNVNLSFGGVDLVLLSSGGRDLTTINCGNITRGIFFSGGESAAAVLQGFTIRDGSAPTGGGILVDESSPVIRDCRFVSCYASNHGGAADLQATSAPLFEDCVFDSNSTIGVFHWGGAVQVLDDASFVRCTFRDNRSDYAGGAVRVDGAGDVTFESCTFEGNSGSDGGAVVDQSGLSTSYESCTFVENHATSVGGALLLGGARHIFTDCLFDLNSCDLGGTMWVTLGDAVLENCTVARTTSDATSAALVVVNSGADIDLTNTIIYGSLSGAAVMCRNYGDVTPVCSNLFGNADGDWDGSCVDGEDTMNGNLSANPFFCDPDNGDFTLASDSPCLAANAECAVLLGAFGQGCGPASVEDPVLPGPAGIMLDRNVPNPFNPRTIIRFHLSGRMDVDLRVFDMSGRLVRVLVGGEAYDQGHHETAWNGRDSAGRNCPSGTYFYRLQAGDYVETKRMTLIK